ncbi:MAG TPA: nitroreductase/quinone reductase family protein [Candidatus Limnocylindrales bacterium]|nr:nitroreductase/quinone reductase family protein [Candidatus Limnocylindrales bacterium]
MATVDPAAFENALIEDMRAHGGAVTSGPLAGHPLLLMWSKGAKTGETRRAILTYSRDGGDYVVAGTAGGSPTAPNWFHNLEANPDIEVEVANSAFGARATIVEGPERDRLWHQHVAALPHFADYPEQTGRVIPVIRLTPLG